MTLHPSHWVAGTPQVTCAQVDLWSLSLPVPLYIESTLEDTLSPVERQRAAGFIGTNKRREFIAGRIALRQVLGRYLGVTPASVELTISPTGKPMLSGRSDLFFNLSHTDGLLLIAVSTRKAVGIDVEKIRPMEGANAMITRYFSARERAATETGGPEAFLRLWTCRESALKAFGTGISAGWDAVRIVTRSRDRADAVGLDQNCHIHLFTPRPGYLAAVAALGTDFQTRKVRTIEFDELETAGVQDDVFEAR